jgi:hypothetical protein
VWWYILVIPALGWLRQETLEFKASLGYIMRSYLKIFSSFWKWYKAYGKVASLVQRLSSLDPLEGKFSM